MLFRSIVNGEVIPEDVYVFYLMDKKEPSKKEKLKELLDSLCTQDLMGYHPIDRKDAIVSHLRLVDRIQKEYNALR